MSHTKNERVFLSEKEAYEHQKQINDWRSPSEEYYRLGVVKCVIRLKDDSLSTGWASRWETYSG